MPLKQVTNTRLSKRQIEEENFENKWVQDPDQFNPRLTALKRDYFKKIKACFNEEVAGKSCVDLGSGSGELAQVLADLGANVTAVDISATALKTIKDNPLIRKEHQFVPYTTLPDDGFDYVIAANLIAEIPEAEQRLFFSELSRIVKPDGKIILSSPLDINSEDALQKLIYLAETELEIETLELSYHRLYIRGLNFLKFVMNPLARWYGNQDYLLKSLEKATQFLYDSDGVSYAILIGKRKCLFEPVPEDHRPIEHKGKKAVWE